VSKKLSEIELYQSATSAQRSTEEACASFPPFEGLALSIQLKKSAKAAVAHITECYGRHNRADRIRLLRLAVEAVDQTLRGLESAFRSKVVKQPEYDKLNESWTAVVMQIDSYVQYLEAGGELEAPLPEA